jgi:RNA polymerase sigma-70 factor (ECF subfamily)
MFEQTLIDQQAKLLRYVNSKVGDPALAEDLFQDSLLKALQSAGDLRHEDRLIPWFYRILNNAIADLYRQREVAARYLPQLAADGTSEMPPEERAALCECFVDLLPTLKPEYAATIRRLDLAGDQPEQVAVDMHISANNLKVRHYRARQALRQRLEETCRICAEHACLDCDCKRR